MRRLRFLRQTEVEIRLRNEMAERPKRIIPWWMLAAQRVGRTRERKQQVRETPGSNAARRLQMTDPRTLSRRSIVKASFSRNRNSGAWMAHARYLTRSGAQQEFSKGRAFDAEREDIDMVATVGGWEQSDKLMWRFIVSPEDGDRLNLRAHVRDLVGKMESDLATKLEWVAIDHHNTDDAHVHLLVRGVRDDGRSLEIDRDYLKSGVRCRSQEIATRALGQRLESEILRARERTIHREQWTEIDRSLQAKARPDGTITYENFHAGSEAALIRAEQEIDRLQYLTDLGLAERTGERAWKISPEHERDLRTRQRSQDVIKSRAHHRHMMDVGLDRGRSRRNQNDG